MTPAVTFGKLSHNLYCIHVAFVAFRSQKHDQGDVPQKDDQCRSSKNKMCGSGIKITDLDASLFLSFLSLHICI
jgi:hypothetical protein